jgi:hypothetical protein
MIAVESVILRRVPAPFLEAERRIGDHPVKPHQRGFGQEFRVGQHSRWGQSRGDILFMALPRAAISIAVFWVPDRGQNAQLVYGFLTFKAIGILMSLGPIP